MRLGYLGPAGTFSEEAARTALDGGEAELVGLATVRDTILAVSDGSVDRAIVPIENSLEGPVGVTLDTLADEDNDVAVVGELVLAVSQHLLAGSDLPLASIERVLSHPQAISQCARFLREHVPNAEVEPCSSTAEAARIVVAQAAPWAAIGTRRAAELYGATVIAEGVEDEPGNATRFVWLARRSEVEAPDVGHAGEDLARLLGLGRRQPRLARALPVGVRLPRREPHEDRVAAHAPAARALPLLRRLRGQRGRRRGRRRRRRPAQALRAGSNPRLVRCRRLRLIRLSAEHAEPGPATRPRGVRAATGAPAART